MLILTLKWLLPRVSRHEVSTVLRLSLSSARPPPLLTALRDRTDHSVKARGVKCAALEPAFAESVLSSFIHLAAGQGRPQCHGT